MEEDEIDGDEIDDIIKHVVKEITFSIKRKEEEQITLLNTPGEIIRTKEKEKTKFQCSYYE
jgi:hypothetical protein